MAEGKHIGKVVHFFGKISVAVVELESDLNIGDTVHFEGAHTDFEQEIDSMQVEKEAVEQVSAGDEVAIKVKERARAGDTLHTHEAE
ncbi:MAG: translation elongation factor-like protein [Chloroflexi bacterium]|nr:translation elongation factor-like protein [Chloroflexota bacterium]